ncbi:MAG: hypothetical protein HKN68_00105 [Saprospiraceae bacterium]|nr:hypothetical protein [Saprospiraceae bacterium]
MIILNFLRELKNRNPFLWLIGWVHVFLFLGAGIMSLLDATHVMGINAWVKPMKFSISITFYLWTFGWIMNELKPRFPKMTTTLSFVIGISMLAEIAVIYFQSWRGVRSHFNFETAFDGSLFAIMGTMIAINTVCIIIVAFLFFIIDTGRKPSYIWAIRLALIVFVAANWVGGYMIGNGAHSVGGEDGGAGIPFLNWSIDHGDMRAAHFFGLHSIQAIPLVGHMLRKKTDALSIVWVFSILYASILGLIFYVAFTGSPLITG